MKVKEVLVHLNESKDIVTVYILSDGSKKKVMDIEISELDKKDPITVQAKLGLIAFNSLGLYGDIEGSALQEDLDRADEMIFDMAESGDPKAQKAVASKCMENGLLLKDLSLLEEAEVWLTRSSDSGYVKATNFLKETWPELKIDYRSRILNDKEN